MSYFPKPFTNKNKLIVKLDLCNYTQKKSPKKHAKGVGTTQSNCICSVLEHFSSKFTIFTIFSLSKPLSFEVKNTLQNPNPKNQIIFTKCSLSKNTKKSQIIENKQILTIKKTPKNHKS